MHKVGVWKETAKQVRIDFIVGGKKTMSMIFPKPASRGKIERHLTTQLHRPVRLKGEGRSGDVYMSQTRGK